MLVIDIKGGINISDMDETVGQIFQIVHRLDRNRWDYSSIWASRVNLADAGIMFAAIFLALTTFLAAAITFAVAHWATAFCAWGISIIIHTLIIPT
jgi:hypothetical protein